MENILTYKKDIPLNDEDYAKFRKIEQLLQAKEVKKAAENSIIKYELEIIELYKKSNIKTITIEELGVKVTSTAETESTENSYEPIIKDFSEEDTIKYSRKVTETVVTTKWDYEKIWKDYKPVELLKKTKAKITITVVKGK